MAYKAVILSHVLLFVPTALSALSQTPLALQRMEHLNVAFDVMYVDLRSYSLELHWKDEEGKPLATFARLYQYLERHNRRLLFATNAGIYDEGLVPHGLHVQDGQQLARINRRGSKCSVTSNFHMKPNGIFFVAKDGAHVVETEAYDERKTHPFLATQSGPLLVLNNRINPCFKERSHSAYIRNGIGVGTTEEVYIVIFEAPVNLYTIASFFKDILHCPNALYLDGAISSSCVECAGDERFQYAGMLAVTHKDKGR